MILVISRSYIVIMLTLQIVKELLREYMGTYKINDLRVMKRDNYLVIPLYGGEEIIGYEFITGKDILPVEALRVRRNETHPAIRDYWDIPISGVFELIKESS